MEEQIAEFERKIKAEKEHLDELEKHQLRARTNLNAIKEQDKQRRYHFKKQEIGEKRKNKTITKTKIKTLKQK